MGTPALGAIVGHDYDLKLVLLSFLISVLGSYVALSLASARSAGQEKVMGTAVALGGCAIWAMHFIGMTAYKTPLYVSYSIGALLASLVIAVGIVALGFAIALRGPRRARNLLLGGAVIGTGVVVMHYLGMSGMEARAEFEWNPELVAASVLIAIVAATVALWLAFNVRGNGQRLVAAVVMGVAVCAMHYTGMAAMTMICTANALHGDYSVDGPYLAYFVFLLALILLSFSWLYNRIRTVEPGPGPRAAA